MERTAPESSPSTFHVDLPGLRDALAGQYTLVRELGRGGMGIVLEARDLKLDRRVALKVLPPALALQPATRERFLREARTAAQLSHPNVVPIFLADELGGFAFFAMGLVEGESLAARVAARGPLPAPEAVRYLRESAWALAYAHASGVVHRDVKPENLLLEQASGRVLVTDFGIARSDEASRLTQTGHVMGSAHWMSPEQGADDMLDGRSDVYALGAVGFFLLSGRPPFRARISGSDPGGASHRGRSAFGERRVAGAVGAGSGDRPLPATRPGGTPYNGISAGR